jgi:formylglycine-generating enzyme required for sulfatase activity
VDSVNWYAAIAFCNKLSTLAGKTRVYESNEIPSFNTDDYWQNLPFSNIPCDYEETNEDGDAITMDKTANGYRLPTEVEWLWAAIGATEGGTDVYTKGCMKGYAGSTEGWDDVEEYAWYGDNSDDVTHQVGQKEANELGLYDMSGNVQEWCFDWYETDNWMYELDPDYVQDTTTENPPTRMTHGGNFYENDWISPSERYDLPPYLADPEDGYCGIVGFRIVCNE